MKTKILKHRVPKRILIGMLLVLFCFTSKAQTWENVHFNVDWQMNVPLNSNTECHNQSIIVCCHNLSSFPFIHSSRRCLHSFNVGLTQEKSSPSVCR